MNLLNELRKDKYSYIMLKPDSREKINDIITEINNHCFEIFKIYYLDPFFPQALIPYENKKTNYDYYQAIKAHLFLSSFYFGNYGLLAILNINDTASLEDFKKEIRKKYTLGEDNSSQMLVNLKHFPIFDHDAPEGILCAMQDNRYEAIPFYKELDGKWGIATLNMLHAPDNNDEYQNDINNFYQKGTIDSANEVSSEGLSLIKKYKTYERIK